jgi:hypothetical protein
MKEPKFEDYASLNLQKYAIEYDSSFVDSNICIIDLAFESIKSKDAFQYEIALHYYKNDVEVEIDNLCLYIINKNDSILIKEFIYNVFDVCKNFMIYDIVNNYFKQSYVPKTNVSKEVAELNENGMTILDVDTNITKTMLDYYYSEYADQMSSDDILQGNRVVKTVGKSCSIGTILDSYLNESDTLKIISDFMKSDIEYDGAGLEYSFEGQSWHKNTQEELSTEYMHFDEDSFVPKILWYLNKVDDERQGATKFIPKSSKWKKSIFKFYFYKALDRVLFNRYRKFIDHSYYLSINKNEKILELLSYLPKQLVGTSHFGGNIENNSEISEQLLSNEITFLSNQDSFILFDGGNNIHRGAVVYSGERIALQIILRPKNYEDIKRIVNAKVDKENLELMFNAQNFLIDKINLIDNDKKIILYGYGISGQTVYNKFKNHKNFIAIVDKNKAGQQVDNIFISYLEDLTLTGDEILFISALNLKTIQSILKDLEKNEIEIDKIYYAQNNRI